MADISLLPTTVPNLDIVLGGGLPVYSLHVFAGPPGTGKTILAQQILFSFVANQTAQKALYISTLSESARKVVRYMQHFQFFDGSVFGDRIIYHDLGDFLLNHPLSQVVDQIAALVNQHQAGIVVIDSFKAIQDLSHHPGELRRFCFELSVQLSRMRCTSILVSECDRQQISQGLEFAIADGIFYLSIEEQAGLPCRVLQVYKLRGRNAHMEPFPFFISELGIKILSPALTLRRRDTNLDVEDEHVETGIPGLDLILKDGIPCGRSLILSGVSGTGKTTFALQFLVAGANRQERGMLFSFEETHDRLYRSAAGFGWDLADLEQAGLLQVICIPQTDIRIEEQLDQLSQAVENFQPKRLVIDSLSVFLSRLQNSALQREKTFQLATLMQQVGGVGLFISDIPAHDTRRFSRFGVEETIADGTIVLSSRLVDKRRERYLEVVKMRSSDYIAGRHRFKIMATGLEVLLMRPQASEAHSEMRSLEFSPLKSLFHGPLLNSSTWLTRGEAGLGKSTLAYQFVIESLAQESTVLYVGMDIPSAQSNTSLAYLGLAVEPYLTSGQLRMLDVFGNTPNLSLEDADLFLYTLTQELASLPRPCRIVIDSLTPLAIALPHHDFVNLIYRKNRLLRQTGVTLFDVFLIGILDEGLKASLINAYDVSLELYRPNWGEMNLAGNVGYPALRIMKSRGVRSDHRPYPYQFSPQRGLVVQREHYQEEIF